MQECVKCGVSEEREHLFNAISSKGVIKMCRKCADEENLPVINKPDPFMPEKTKSVYERLSSMANLDAEKHKLAVRGSEEAIKRDKQNKTLKDVLDDNFRKKIALKPRTDLIENFHWNLMRVRRSRKLTQKQVAETLGETEETIKMAEGGAIPENSDALVRKLENYFKIRLLKDNGVSSFGDQRNVEIKGFNSNDSAKAQIREKFEKDMDFDAETTQALSIADLQEIKRKRENSGGLFSFFRKKKDTSDNKSETSKEETD